MASFDWPKGLVQRALREGVGATDALRVFRDAGGRIRTQSWYRLYSQAQLEGVMSGREAGANLRSRPTSGEIQTATSRRATGYMQRVTVMGRDAGGNIISREVSFRSNNLVSRQNAINKALALVQGGIEGPEGRERYAMSSVMAGFYSGTFQFEPEALE